MSPVVEFVGPNHALQLFGIKLVGINAENGLKALFTLILFTLVLLVGKLLRALVSRVSAHDRQAGFWTRQGVHVVTAVIILLGVVSIWFDDPARLTTAMGLVTAGLAFALQRVVTALAGYILILRGTTFNVGDRIVMGGVRGDVIALGFLQTTIMEMGQPPSVQSATPAMWVRSRQYTGRIVTISNAKIFDEPVYNYSREFPYIWEEMVIPISYRDDAAVVEGILLAAAGCHTVTIEQLSESDLGELQRRYAIQRSDIAPRVYYVLTDNWVELTVRFIAKDHGIRDLKDAMSRDILQALNAANISIASATFEVTGVPPLHVRRDPPKARAP